MKTKKTTFAIALTACIMFMLTAITTQSQIQFTGLISQGEGIAGWNADGSGPEPEASGHIVPGFGNSQYYYGSSRDFITGNEDEACFHFLPDITGFPEFEQALIDNGFTAGQVKCKYGLTSLEDDIEGEDWFFMNSIAYSNYYNTQFVFELDGEPILSGNYSYANMYINTTGGNWQVETGFTPLLNVAGPGTPAFEVSQAFLNDLDGQEIKMSYEAVYTNQDINENGRDGAYYNVLNGLLEAGYPTIPFIGLPADHEGVAYWDSDGSGSEPLRNGHGYMLYYGASRDYDGIDPDPNAAFGHFLDNAEGFTNFYLQMEYRGYTPDQIKIKSGICDFDEDIEGEDWIGQDTLNYYHSLMRIELDNEPLFGFMIDTLNYTQESIWNCVTSPAIAYNASENSSTDMQLIAEAFFKDLESRQLNLEFTISSNGTFEANGRDGYLYEVNIGHMVAKMSNCTRVYAGNVTGIWHAGCSPYIIEGDITVPNGETLTIEPGVWVKFMDRYPINVQGSVVAVGDGTNTGDIVFTAINPEKGWGGIELYNTNNTNDSSFFTNCIFEYGYAQGGVAGLNSGGAFAAKNFSKINIDQCLFKYNWADKSGTYPPSGGAIGLWNSNPIIQNSGFYGNHASYGGAIILFTGSHPTIDHCLFHHNTADTDAGAVIVYTNCDPDITNCTFVQNSTNGMGGAVVVHDSSDPDFVNCILFDNSAAQGKQIAVSTSDCTLDISYCDIEGGEAGIGPNGIGASGTYENNIEEDPMFAQELAWNFRLSDASPCINAGDPTIVDPDGTVSDMGAFYYSIPPAPVAIEGIVITNTSFHAKWVMDYAVTGYIIDVATDESFDSLVPGYEGLDVGYTYIYEVTVSAPTVYYYRLKAYNAAGISEYSNTILVFITDIEETLSESSSGLIVVPNPVNSQGNIILELNEASKVQIEVFNYTGQKVLNISPEKQQKGMVSIPVDFGLLPNGSYICKITTEKSFYTTKFIKN
ncbi:MAG: hypothetical protein DRJ05_13370 [Bacteroidetes bacterium]|nr:MAG: hypothetical protein DRJ05_13370 [Bacteroidota bacterium]